MMNSDVIHQSEVYSLSQGQTNYSYTQCMERTNSLPLVIFLLIIFVMEFGAALFGGLRYLTLLYTSCDKLRIWKERGSVQI